MKKIFCSVVVFAITSLSVQAITLEEALIAAARYKQAVLAFLPNVSGTVSATRERDDRHRKVLKLDAGKTNTETTGTNMSLTVSQNIFSGFSTTNTMAAAEHSNNAAFHKLRSEEQTLVLNVVNAYTEIWFCRKRLDALKKMVENLKNTMQAQQSSFEAGMATPTDVAEAESKYQGAIYSMINSETELMTAEADFERLTRKQADDDMSLPDFPFELPKSLKKLMEECQNWQDDETEYILDN